MKKLLSMLMTVVILMSTCTMVTPAYAEESTLTSITSLTAKNNGFTLKWKKQTQDTTGYKFQYSTDKKFKKNVKNVWIKNKKTTSKTVSGLKSNKKYYVRICTYETIEGEKFCSDWSKTRSVTTKSAKSTKTSKSKKSSKSGVGSTVYITPTGKKYHASKSCAGKNAEPVKLSEAKKTYDPCKKCC